MYILELAVVVLIGGLSFLVGAGESAESFQQRCVVKYADMPHNKVSDYCKTLLKFDVDPK